MVAKPPKWFKKQTEKERSDPKEKKRIYPAGYEK